MKLKAIGTVQIAGKGGQVTEHKPGTTFNVGAEEGARLVEARHAEKVGADAEEAVVTTPTKAPAAATGTAGTEAGNKDAPAP